MQKPVPQHVIEYARAHGYTHDIFYHCEWNGYTVYIPDFSYMPEKSVWGLPSYILTKGDMIRWANMEEVDILMGL